MHFSLVRISPPGANPTHALDDVMLPMYYALRALGFTVEIRLNDCNPSSRNILFGTCLTPRKADREAPRGSIIMNLEQAHSAWFTGEYLDHLKKFTVWDYSLRNIAFLKTREVSAEYLPFGYVPEMSRLDGDGRKDIDVLFYGFLNKRRLDVINSFRDIRLMAVQKAFGQERDDLLKRAKIVLNIHFYSPASLEVARLGYVWANKLAVAAERGPDTEIPQGLEGACAYFDYDHLADGVLSLLENDKMRQAQAESGYNAFAGLSFAESLKRLVGSRIHAATSAGVSRPGSWLITGPVS